MKNIIKDGRTTCENKIDNDNILSTKSTNYLLKLKYKRKIKRKKLTNTMKSENEEIKNRNIIKNNLKEENEMVKDSNFNFNERVIETGKVSSKKNK